MSSSARLHSDVADQQRAVEDSLILPAIATLLVHVAIHDGSPTPWVEWVDLVVTVLLAVCMYWLFRAGRGLRATSVVDGQPGQRNSSTDTLVVSKSQPSQLTTRSLPSLVETAFLVLFGLLPLATDLVLRRFASHGNPLEIQLTLAIRNMMLGLIVLPNREVKRLAVFTSLFLAIYGALVTVSVATNVLLVTYALSGLWWLMGNYWQRISAHFPSESTAEIPYFARVGAVVAVMTCLAGGVLAFQSSAVTSAVAGFMPSSGGTGGSDPFARGGVGDGDQMVGAKEDASSFGPIESELFLESQQPTLYDMFIETYEPPTPKRKRGRTRAIPLSSREDQKQNHTRLAQNKKSSREFSAIRRQSKNRKRPKLDNLESKALLYVAGRTPLHLGLAIFDHWDGQSLSRQGDVEEPALRLQKDDQQRNWATWDQPSYAECFAEQERHLLKIINLKAATVPAPPTLTGAHIDKLHDAGLFRWEDGLLRLTSDKIPSLTVLHVHSRRLHRNQLDRLALRRDQESQPTTSPRRKVEIPARLEQLALQWTGDAKSDWERVDKICAELRKFDHDAKALVPETTSDAVQYFLFEAREGPDYLFATSAALLLRSLGYQTRVISGLYADPENYDRLAKATGVYSTNVHFWAEVQTVRGHWIPVEATPGFQLLYARQTFMESVAGVLSGITARILAQPFLCLLTTVLITGAIAFRLRIYSWLATIWWQCRLNTSPRQQVLRSVSLLQRLAVKKQSGRRAGQTLDQWIEALSESRREASAVAEFRSLVAWACYASSDRPAYSGPSVRQICVDSVRLLKERV